MWVNYKEMPLHFITSPSVPKVVVLVDSACQANLYQFQVLVVVVLKFCCIVTQKVNKVINFLLCRCWWSFKAGDQGHPHQLRPQPVSGGSSALRSQEIRWTRRSRQIPEVLPINQKRKTKVYFWHLGSVVVMQKTIQHGSDFKLVSF